MKKLFITLICIVTLQLIAMEQESNNRFGAIYKERDQQILDLSPLGNQHYVAITAGKDEKYCTITNLIDNSETYKQLKNGDSFSVLPIHENDFLLINTRNNVPVVRVKFAFYRYQETIKKLAAKYMYGKNLTAIAKPSLNRSFLALGYHQDNSVELAIQPYSLENGIAWLPSSQVSLDPKNGQISTLRFSPTNDYLAVGQQDAVSIFSTKPLQLITGCLFDQDTTINAISWQNNEILFLSTAKGLIHKMELYIPYKVNLIRSPSLKSIGALNLNSHLKGLTAFRENWLYAYSDFNVYQIDEKLNSTNTQPGMSNNHKHKIAGLFLSDKNQPVIFFEPSSE